MSLFLKKNNNKYNEEEDVKIFLKEFEKDYNNLKINFSKNILYLNDPYSENITKYYHNKNVCILCGIKKKLLECYFCKNIFCKKHILIRKKLNKICNRCKMNDHKKNIDDLFLIKFNILNEELQKNKSIIIELNDKYFEIINSNDLLKKKIDIMILVNNQDKLKKRSLILKNKRLYNDCKLKYEKINNSLTILNSKYNEIIKKYQEKKLFLTNFTLGSKLLFDNYDNNNLFKIINVINKKIISIKRKLN